MPTSFAFRPFPLAILLLAVVAGAFAQDPTNADGVQPLEAQYSEVVLNDLNLHLDIPIVNKAGVGLPFAFGLHFNNNFYDPISGKWAQNWNFMGGVSAFGWVSGDTQVFGTLVGYSTFCPSNPWYQHMITLWGYMDTSGTLHSFPGIPPLNPIDGDWGCGFGFSSLTGLLSYNYNLSFNLYFDQNFNLTATLTAPNGSVLHPAIVIWDTNTNAISHSPGMSLSDVNSNSITKSSTVNPGYQTFTDTLAVQELKYAGQGYCQTPGGSGDTSTTYLYPTSTGASSVLVSCKRYSIQTNFGCAGVSEYPATYAYLVDSVTLADNSQYKFTYESQVTNTVTGRLASVTFPKGALYKYTYVGSNAGTVCGDGSVYGLTRTTPDGTWTFSRPDSTNSAFTTTVTGPSPSYNTTKYTFSSGELLQKQVFQGSSALLKTDVYCYNGNQTNCVSNPNLNLQMSEIDVYSTLAGMTSSGRTMTKLDSYGNVTNTSVYDFGATVPIRQSVGLNYGQSWNGTTCVAMNNGVQNAPCEVQVQDGSGHILRNTRFTYDAKGNLTSSSQLVSGSTYLTTKYVRNPNGTISTITDANANQTSLSYANCNGGMPTQVTVWPVPAVLSLSSQSQWDLGSSICNGAKVTSVTDPNGNSVTASYNDPFWRITSSTDELQNTVNFSYSPTTSEAQESFNGNSSDYDILGTSDSLGRPLYAQVIEGPGGQWDTRQFGYGWNSTGRVTTLTTPCVSTRGSGCSTAQSTVTHDALGRPLFQTDAGGGTVNHTYTGRDVLTVVGPAPAGEVVKRVQQEYNGAGQLVSTCRLSSAAGNTVCGQDSGGTGFVTSYLYNSTGTTASISRKSSSNTQTRSFTYDAIGRTLTASYPESGKKWFFYDVAPSTPGVACSPSTFYGQLVKTYDPNGNTACYAYDGVNRVISVTYTGPNFDGNNKYFAYDSAVVNGVTMVNTAGQLAEAYTAPSVSGTKVTDEGLSYTKRGELSDVYQFTPHSGGYYHTIATYFANGELNKLSGITAGPWTFGIDGKGRPYSAVQGSSTNLVGSTTYNAADQPLVVTLGLGDSDSYSYDPNTGRTRNYTFTIGATPKSISGNLMWNQNGTLRQLAISDGANSGGTQTCNYGTSTTPGYDELGNLVSVDCGASVWQQNFSYDPFNNITKSVPLGGTGITWMPGYNQANNHYALGGTSYDSNGNLLTDTFHTYTWNQDNHPLAVVDAGVTATYDAFGRMVERKAGTAYHETLLSPIGNLGVMNQQNVSQFRVLLPGGPIAVSGVDFWHKDWLGSVRLVSSRGGRASLTDRAFAPYGETYKNIGAATNVNFTGDNQDLVAGTYDTPNRELNPNQGRWISPDPAHAGWNAYAYSTKPLGTVDTSGLCDGWAGDGCAGDGGDFGDGSIGGLAIDSGQVSLLSSVIPVGLLALPCYPNCGVGGGDDWFQPVIYLPLGLGGDCIGSGCVVPAGITPRIGVPGDTVDVIGTPCAPPTAPAGSGANVDQNIAATKSAVSTFHPVTAGLPGGSPTGDVGAFDGWYNHVKAGGDWDYATKYGRNSTNSMFGNFNYGATCSAMGFSLETCQRGAGAVDYYNAVKNVFNGRPWSAGPGNPFTGSPVNVHGYPDYGDQTHYAENESVIAGWIYGSGGCQ